MPQHAEATTAPEEEVFSPDVSMLAQLPANCTTSRVASASDARCHGIDTLHQLPEQLSPAQEAACAAADKSEAEATQPIVSSPMGRQQQHSRHSERSAAGVTSDFRRHLRQDPVLPHFAGTQDGGSGEPAWGPPGAPTRGQSPAHESAAQAADAGHSLQGQLQHQSSRNNSANAVDSNVGAILQGISDDEADGEVVEESDMYQQCFKGHCNLSSIKEVHSCAVTLQVTQLITHTDIVGVLISADGAIVTH